MQTKVRLDAVEAAKRIHNMQFGSILYLEFWEDCKLVSEVLLAHASKVNGENYLGEATNADQ